MISLTRINFNSLTEIIISIQIRKIVNNLKKCIRIEAKYCVFKHCIHGICYQNFKEKLK